MLLNCIALQTHQTVAHNQCIAVLCRAVLLHLSHRAGAVTSDRALARLHSVSDPALAGVRLCFDTKTRASWQAMPLPHSFRCTTTAEDGDMALALALAETDRAQASEAQVQHSSRSNNGAELRSDLDGHDGQLYDTGRLLRVQHHLSN